MDDVLCDDIKMYWKGDCSLDIGKLFIIYYMLGI